MRKFKVASFILVAITLIICNAPTSRADIFTKIGNAIDKGTRISEGVFGKTNSPTTSNTQSTGNGSSRYGAAPGVEVYITDAAKWGEGALFFYTVKNNMSQDLSQFLVTHASAFPGECDTRGFFDDGTEFYSSFDITSLSVPAGGKRSWYVKVDKTPKNVQSADLMLFARCNTGPVVTGKNPYGICLYNFKSIPIRGFQPSNINGVYCTHPDLKVNVNNVSRKESSVEIDFSLINPTEKDLQYWLMSYDGTPVLDADGNGYKISVAGPAGKNTLNLPAEGGKVRIVATIPNVPKSVKELQQVIVPFGNNDSLSRFSFVFKNLPINN